MPRRLQKSISQDFTFDEDNLTVEMIQDTGASYVNHFGLVIEEYEALGETAVNALYPVGELRHAATVDHGMRINWLNYVDHTHTSPTGE